MAEPCTQLQAGLARHDAKPSDQGQLVYEDKRITVRDYQTRNGIHRVQFNKPSAGTVVLLHRG